MLGGGVFSSAYTMQADVYEKIRSVSASGQLSDDWRLNESIGNQGVIDCVITEFPTTSFRAQAMNQEFGTKLKELAFFKLTCNYDLGHNAKVTNIRDKKTGNVIYIDVDLQGSPPVWFNCNGSTPMTDPFRGPPVQFDTTIHRAEVQG